MIYITSDWHFNHNKPFIYEPRGFNNVYDMNETIIKNHNTIVNSNDDVFCLGDCMLENNEEGIKLIKQLKGKIHIILGNHCTDTRAKMYQTCYNVVDVTYAERFNYQGYHFYLSHYPTLCDNHDGDKPLERRVINLCGHCHTEDKFADWSKGLIYHVELDAHQNCPVLLDNIIKDIKEKINNEKKHY